jgi:ribonuclease E
MQPPLATGRARCRATKSPPRRQPRPLVDTAMDENKPASSWDDLLKEIGANPVSDAAERRRPAIENTFDPPPVAKVAPPKPKPGNWNALASDLGIEVPPEPATPAKAERPAPSAKAERPAGPGAIESTFAGIEPIESEFEDVVEDEIADIDFSDGDGDEALYDDEGEDSDDDDDGDYEEAEDDDEPLGDDDDSLPPSALSGEAARSAFEALFQAGSFTGNPPPRAPQPPRGRSAPPRDDDDDIFGESERPARAPREPRQERPSSPPREPRRGAESRNSESRSSASRGGESRDSRGAEARGGEDRPRRGESRRPAEPVEDREATEGGSEEGRPRRRRRRGGRGRGASRSGPGSERPEAAPVDAGDDWQQTDDDDRDLNDVVGDDESSQGEGEVTADRGERPRRRRSRRGRGRSGAGSTEEGREPRGPAKPTESRAPTRNGRPARPPVESDDDDDDEGMMPIAGENDDDDDDSELGRSSHKSIPSWSEAIGVMVDVNMQGRKSSPQRPSSRGGSGGRGRGRGGRGRGGGGRDGGGRRGS